MNMGTTGGVRERIVADPLAHANEIRPLLRSLQPQTAEDLLAFNIRTTKLFFEAVMPGLALKGAVPSDDMDMKFREWVCHQLNQYKHRLKGLLQHGKSRDIQALALVEAMAALTLEPHTEFDNTYFLDVLRGLTHTTLDSGLLEVFTGDFMKFADVRYYVLRGIPALCREASPPAADQAPASCTVEASSQAADGGSTGGQVDVRYRLYSLLRAAGQLPDGTSSKSWCGAIEAGEVVPLRRAKGKRKRTDEGPAAEEGRAGQRKARWASPRYQQKALTEAWLAFLALPLPPHLLKQVLQALPGDVMPHMSSPHLLADFFAGAVERGGLLGILALNGLFRLVTKHQFEYPQFYARLYTLLTAGVFQAGYRVQFFELMDIFLASGKVPAYTAAAFVKKLARLSLRISPAGALVALAFIHNVMRRHPALRALLDAPQVGSAGESASSAAAGEDPFRQDEPDLTQTRAHESSLWEIQTLTNHYCPQVARAAAVLLEKDLSDRRKTAEVDCGALFPASYTSLVVGEASRRLKGVSTTYFSGSLPSSLAAGCPVPHLVWT